MTGLPFDPGREWLVSRLIALGEPPPEAAPVRDNLDFHDDFAVGAAAPAAVLVGLIRREEGLSVLLTRRADSLRRHTGQIAFPGGRCDPGETPLQTAVREANEEIGLEPDCVDSLGFADPHHTRTGFWVTPAVALVEAKARFAPSPQEVAEIFEVPFAYLMNPANHQQRTAMLNGKERRFYAIEYGERLIWGVTASIIVALHQRLSAGGADV